MEKLSEEQRREKENARLRAYYAANRKSIIRNIRRHYAKNREAAEKTGLPEALKRARKNHRYTQQELGDLCGVSQSAVSRWESGELRFDPQTVGRWLPELPEAVRRERDGESE